MFIRPRMEKCIGYDPWPHSKPNQHERGHYKPGRASVFETPPSAGEVKPKAAIGECACGFLGTHQTKAARNSQTVLFGFVRVEKPMGSAFMTILTKGGATGCFFLTMANTPTSPRVVRARDPALSFISHCRRSKSFTLLDSSHKWVCLCLSWCLLFCCKSNQKRQAGNRHFGVAVRILETTDPNGQSGKIIHMVSLQSPFPKSLRLVGLPGNTQVPKRFLGNSPGPHCGCSVANSTRKYREPRPLDLVYFLMHLGHPALLGEHPLIHVVRGQD